MSSGLRFTLDIEGLPSNMFPVVDFSLNESLSSLFRLDVSVSSEYFTSLSHEMVTEKTAILKIWEGETVLRHVKGIVTGFNRGEFDGQRTDYWLEIRPPFWRSALRQNFRSFQNQDIETIITTLLGENGVTEYSPLLGDEHPPREFCVQYGETDYDFLLRLMAEEGIFFYEEYADDGENQWLILVDNVAHLPVPLEIRYNPDKSSGTTTDHIDQFSHSFQVSPSSVVSQDYTFKRPGWRGRFKHAGENADWQRDQYEIFDYPGRFKDERQGMDFARRQVEGLRNGAETALCNTGSPKLWPGMRFTMSEHPLDSLNRTWQVVNCYMRGEQPQAVPGSAGEGTTLTNQVHVIPADRTWHSAPQPKPRVDGPQSATVTGPEGEEIFCDEYGRVRVKFAWDRYNKPNQDSSCWVRVSQAWAGTGFGNLAIPRVGQEVIVDFLNGDPDQPIIMGRTYREDNMPQGGLPGTKTQMSIRSKTYKGNGFNELRFEDATEKEEIFIHAQLDMNTVVLQDKKTEIERDNSLYVTRDMKTEVHRHRNTIISEEDDESIGGNKTLTISKNNNIDITGQQVVSVGKSRISDIRDNDEIRVGKHIILHSDSGDITIGNAGGRIFISSMGDIRIEGKSITFAEHPAGVLAGIPKFDYMARYQLKSEKTGKPLRNVPYKISAPDGQVISGVSDAQGRTLMIQTETEGEVSLEIEIPKKPKLKKLYLFGEEPVEILTEFKED